MSINDVIVYSYMSLLALDIHWVKHYTFIHVIIIILVDEINSSNV